MLRKYFLLNLCIINKNYNFPGLSFKYVDDHKAKHLQSLRISTSVLGLL